MAHPLPTDHNYGKLLGGTLGKPAEVKKGTPFDPKPGEAFTLAVFIDDANKKTALCLCDVPLTCAMGACLTMIPPAVAKDAAKEAAKSCDIPEMIFDNAKEIFNISSSIFNVRGSPHLRLGPVFKIPPVPPADILALIGKAGERVDFKITIPNYDSGLMSFRWVG